MGISEPDLIHSTTFDPAEFEKGKRDGMVRCHLCVYFDPIGNFNGLCRVTRPAVEVLKDGWCGDFRGRA